MSGIQENILGRQAEKYNSYGGEKLINTDSEMTQVVELVHGY